MRIVVLLFLFGLIVLPAAESSGFSTKGQDCSKCHTLKKDEAAALLKGFDQNIKVLGVGFGSVKYLFEISVESNGKKGIIYIDFPKKHLFTGSLYQIQGKRNLSQESLSEINKVNVSQIPLGDAIVLGEKNAKYRVIVFDDPE
jgi:thiol:disulfide interchange protein DsbC